MNEIPTDRLTTGIAVLSLFLDELARAAARTAAAIVDFGRAIDERKETR